MTTRVPLLVPGAQAAGTLDVEAPYDRATIASVELADGDGAETALATAARLFKDRDAWLDKPERIAILRRTREIMQERREQLAVEAAREGGKPLTDSLVEVDRAIDGVDWCVDELRNSDGRRIPMNLNAASGERLAYTFREPIGPVLAFSAFNHPFNLIVHQVAPAVATGCPVIVKPAEATPLSAWSFVKILHEAGLPPEWAQALLTTDLDVAGAMVADPRLGFFTFIGSARVGWMLRSKLAPGVRCALEHGGAAPALIAADADIDKAIPVLLKGGFYHSGQVCVSVQRILAHESIAHEVADRLATRARAVRVGDPTSGETDIGPLIRPSEVDRVGTWVREAVDGGAELLCGGEPIGDTCYAPTVLYDPPADAQISREEVFGPVVSVSPFEDLDEGIARANDLPYAFQAAIFTRDLDTSLRAARRLDASAVMVNDHTAFRVDWMPFAGLKQSGLGIGGIGYTMHDMSIEKMIVVRSGEL